MNKLILKTLVTDFQRHRTKIRGIKYIRSAVFIPKTHEKSFPGFFKLLKSTKYIQTLETYDRYSSNSKGYLRLFKQIGKGLRVWFSYFTNKINSFYSRSMFHNLRNLREIRATSISPFLLRFLTKLETLKLIGFTHKMPKQKDGIIHRNTYLRNLKTLGLDTRTFDLAMLLVHNLDRNTTFSNSIQQFYLSCGVFGNGFPIDWSIWSKLNSICAYFHDRNIQNGALISNLKKFTSLKALGLTMRGASQYLNQVKGALSAVSELNCLEILNLYIELKNATKKDCLKALKNFHIPSTISTFKLECSGQTIPVILNDSLINSFNRDKIKVFSLNLHDLNELKGEDIKVITSTFSDMRYLQELYLHLGCSDSNAAVDIAPLMDSWGNLTYLKTLECEIHNLIFNSGVTSKAKLTRLETLKIGPFKHEENGSHTSIEEFFRMIEESTIKNLQIHCSEPMDEDALNRRLQTIGHMKKLNNLSVLIRMGEGSPVTRRALRNYVRMLSGLLYLNNLNFTILGTAPFGAAGEYEKIRMLLKHQFKFLTSCNLTLGNDIISI